MTLRCERAILCLPLLLFLCASTFANGPLHQFGKVEVSELLDGSGPTVLTSNADEPLDLVLGFTGLEARLSTSFFGTPFGALFGQIFVQANAVMVPESTAMARYEYDFSLSHESELQFLSFTLQNDGAGSLLLERNGSPLYSSSGEDLRIFGIDEVTLSPGFYELTVEASATISDRVVGFRSSQVDFALAFNTVPEPSTLLLASVAGLMCGIRRRRS